MSAGIHLSGWHCPPAFRWVRDSDRILVVDPAGQNVFPLFGEEAALWSWLAAGMTESAVVPLLAEWMQIAPEEAAARLATFFARWRAAGLLADRETPDG